MASVRLRPLTEAECYARCYGGRREESVALLWLDPPETEAAPEPRDGAGHADASDRRDAA